MEGKAILHHELAQALQSVQHPWLLTAPPPPSSGLLYSGTTSNTPIVFSAPLGRSYLHREINIKKKDKW